MESIKRNGICQEFEVTKGPKKYYVVKGQRRLMAVKELVKTGYPIEKVRCILKKLSPAEEMVVSFLADYLSKPVVQKDYSKTLVAMSKLGWSKKKILETLSMSDDDFEYYSSLIALEEPEKATDFNKAMKQAKKVEKTRGLEGFSLPETISQDKELIQSLKDLNTSDRIAVIRKAESLKTKEAKTELIKKEIESLKTSRLCPVRIQNDFIEGLKTYAVKTGSRNPFYELEKLIQELIGEFLRKEGCIV